MAEVLHPVNEESSEEAFATLFRWQNTLLRFYLDTDVDKAFEYGRQLLKDLDGCLPDQNLCDLFFSIATGFSLGGTGFKLSWGQGAIHGYDAVLTILNKQPHLKGFRKFLGALVLNNLGMTHFYEFLNTKT